MAEAGEYSDCVNCDSLDCEEFYFMLNQLEDHEYSSKMEEKQSKAISTMFKKHINEAEGYYNFFLAYFRQYVQSSKSTLASLQ